MFRSVALELQELHDAFGHSSKRAPAETTRLLIGVVTLKPGSGLPDVGFDVTYQQSIQYVESLVKLQDAITIGLGLGLSDYPPIFRYHSCQALKADSR